jgi:hypothetical protein
MKKYLMSGIAALALCAAFTSCSNNDLYDEGQIQENAKQAVYNNYNEAFIKTFGKPASNQQWGFINYSQARTRDHAGGKINVNGNMWSTAPAVDVPDEVNAIFDYVKEGIEYMDEHEMPYGTEHPKNLNGYFVTQVRNGLNDDNNYTNHYNGDAAVDAVGAHMDHLQIKFTESATLADLTNANNGSGWEVTGWEHINNFNGSSNANHSNTTSPYNGNTLVQNAGAYDFAYYNSADSKFHNKWILVDGADIESTGKYADFYYVCFDYEIRPEGNKTRYEYFKDGHWGWNDAIDGTFFTDEELQAELARQGIDAPQARVTSWEQQDKMLEGDNKYTDWIIRITKGEKPIEWDLRIIAEDLNATATEGEPENSDWDFNDVVLDVKFLGSDKVRIRVFAAGATLPIRINGEDALEVHGLYDKPTNIMINTGAAAAGYPNQAYESNGVYPEKAIFERTISRVDATNGKAIKIEVYKTKDGVADWYELTANEGEPASKMGVSPNFTPCKERQDIKGRYTNFVNWVTTNDPQIWWYTDN